jgi:hypothetical protein
VELGLTGALVADGGGRSAVVAGVLVFRALTYLVPIVVGALTYVIWRRRRSWWVENPGHRPVAPGRAQASWPGAARSTGSGSGSGSAASSRM